MLSKRNANGIPLNHVKFKTAKLMHFKIHAYQLLSFIYLFIYKPNELCAVFNYIKNKWMQTVF